MAGPRINLIFSMDTSEFQRNLRQAERQLGNFGKRMEDIGGTLTTRLTLPLAAVGGAALQAFAQMDKFTKGLGAVMGSTQAAEAELVKLREVAKLPGLGFQEAVQGSTNLQAVGLTADEARKTLQGFGAAIAATGGGAAELGEVQRQLTQIISKNRILQEDYGVLQERVPLIGRALEQAFGTSNIEKVRQMGVSGREFVSAISQALITLPQTQNLTGGLANGFENLSDSTRNALATFGEAINRSLGVEKALNALGDTLNALADGFASLSPTTQKVIVIFGAFVAAIGPVLFAIGAFSKVAALASAGAIALGKACVFMTGPIGLTIAAIGAVVAALTILYVKSESVRKVINAIGSTFSELITIMKEGAAGIIEGFGLLLEGEFVKGGKKIQEGLKKVNPISAAFAEGGRLRDAFNKGFADNTNYLAGVQKQFEQATSGFKTGQPTLPDAVTGGGVDITPRISQPTIVQYQKLIEGLTKTITKKFGDSRKAVEGFNSTLAAIPDVQSPVEATRAALAEYDRQIELSTAKTDVFGRSVGEDLAEKIQITESAIVTAIEAFGQNSFAVETLVAALQNLKNSQDPVIENQKLIAEYQTVIGTAFNAAAGLIEQSGLTIQNVLRAVGRAVLQAAADFVRGKIVEAIAAWAADAFKKFGILGVAVAAAGGAIVGSVFQGIINKVAPPRLARGGVTTGETLAVVGDNPSGKEAIIPFERMGEFLNMAGGGGTRVFGQFEVRGQDLVLVLDRAQQSKARVR